MKQYLLGGLDPALYAACFIAACVGVLFILLIGTSLRDPLSANSPAKWSWSYLMSDNAKRIYANIIAIIVSLRFMTELFGWELTVWKGFIIGTGWDAIALIIKQKTNLFESKKVNNGNKKENGEAGEN